MEVHSEWCEFWWRCIFLEAQFSGDYFGGYAYLAKAQFGGNAFW